MGQKEHWVKPIEPETYDGSANLMQYSQHLWGVLLYMKDGNIIRKKWRHLRLTQVDLKCLQVNIKAARFTGLNVDMLRSPQVIPGHSRSP